jgi:hypothetical protein
MAQSASSQLLESASSQFNGSKVRSRASRSAARLRAQGAQQLHFIAHSAPPGTREDSLEAAVQDLDRLRVDPIRCCAPRPAARVSPPPHSLGRRREHQGGGGRGRARRVRLVRGEGRGVSD